MHSDQPEPRSRTAQVQQPPVREDISRGHQADRPGLSRRVRTWHRTPPSLRVPVPDDSGCRPNGCIERTAAHRSGWVGGLAGKRGILPILRAPNHARHPSGQYPASARCTYMPGPDFSNGRLAGRSTSNPHPFSGLRWAETGRTWSRAALGRLIPVRSIVVPDCPADIFQRHDLEYNISTRYCCCLISHVYTNPDC